MPVSKDGLILCSDGDVQELDLAVLEAVIEQAKKPGYFENVCQPKGGCSLCTLPACPVTN